ncbi:uncharacterized protein LOC122060583 isoform X2 [Macadamia integrifolia]|uniref:uncharacterized protein LOC122060583 isoform X2 n=1 Tax=Macadamia integrifolia TaxID=60698 RepID=UPI001C52BD93|nr:uncharacterized protein LOC122060583 isoform X2 [Macadamia integrifolia]
MYRMWRYIDTINSAANMFPPEKPCTAPVSVGVIRPARPLVNVSALASASSMNHLSVNQVQPAVVSREPSSGSLEKDSSSSTLPRTEVAHFRLDGRLNGPAFATRVRENTSGDHQFEKAPRLGQTNKVSDHTPIKTKGSSNISSSQVALQAAKDQGTKPSVIQTVSGSLPSVQQPSLGIHFIHNDIARNVRKFLQPRIPEHPNWTPPSVKYMNKPLTCQICKATISDVESLLVCDACEKGVHLKCLHLYNKKSIPKGEWHCPKCILSSSEKPLPPKYGPVM